jgi:hypothetical protein
LIIGALAAAVLLRVGVLAAFMMMAAHHVLTLDTHAWHFAFSRVAIIGLIALSMA